MLTFSVSKLMNMHEGTKEAHTLDEPVVFKESEGLKVGSSLTGKVTFYVLENEISVHAENLEIDIEIDCSYCLKKIIQHIVIPQAERSFFIERKEVVSDPLEGNFLVDMHRREISLFEMVRQEIHLHFPLNPVCYEGCKGLCNQCGQNLNNKDCGHKKLHIADTKNPFAHLKNLM